MWGAFTRIGIFLGFLAVRGLECAWAQRVAVVVPVDRRAVKDALA
jgi:hypothetical protein